MPPGEHAFARRRIKRGRTGKTLAVVQNEKRRLRWRSLHAGAQKGETMIGGYARPSPAIAAVNDGTIVDFNEVDRLRIEPAVDEKKGVGIGRRRGGNCGREEGENKNRNSGSCQADHFWKIGR